jgi:hypothetical protein
MDYNIDENRSVFIKTDKTSFERFIWFTENQLVTVSKIQILKNKKPENLSDKLEKSSDKPVKPIGLPFFIQNLNF